MSEPVAVPGGRDVRGSLDEPDDRAEPTACVVACPPHPQLGGSRSDRRLTAVADALTDRDTACLRFDYGEWGEGRGELRDTRAAVAWAAERYGTVGLFGYSFGGCLALVAAAEREDRETEGSTESLAAVSALAPASRVGDGTEAVDAVVAVERIDCPGQVVYGSRDDTVDWAPVVERARERGLEVAELTADHHFVGQAGKAARVVADFLDGRV
ncbi:alpha/beta hydrolase [Halosimplex litoreum]|uniref:alpha/beta hydrolase n=1 Tax=Halosimplex litoreum TaxID=1198301 RepID=UPI003742E7D9